MTPSSGGSPLDRALDRAAGARLIPGNGGARRSIAGAMLFVSVGVGALFVILPRTMAYVVAGVCFWLGAGAGWQFLQRRRQYRDE